MNDKEKQERLLKMMREEEKNNEDAITTAGEGLQGARERAKIDELNETAYYEQNLAERQKIRKLEALLKIQEASLKIQKSLSFIKWQLIGIGAIIIIGLHNLMDILKKIYFNSF